MTKSFRKILLTIALLMIMVKPCYVNAADHTHELIPIETGECGDYFSWSITSGSSDNGMYVLSVKGFDSTNGILEYCPQWEQYWDNIYKIEISGDYKILKERTFADMSKLEKVSIDTGMKMVGDSIWNA